MDWNKICESAISGVFVGSAMIIANKIIVFKNRRKEFQKDLALIIIELYNNLAILPDAEICDVDKQCEHKIFETSVWDSLKTKLILELKKPTFTRIAVLYHSLRNSNIEKSAWTFADGMRHKTLIICLLNELLKISNYDFDSLSAVVESRHFKIAGKQKSIAKQRKPLEQMTFLIQSSKLYSVLSSLLQKFQGNTRRL